ncbi:MAG: peptide-methionine (R)-S-oxide reductase MsrB [Chlamydiota bacterium]
MNLRLLLLVPLLSLAQIQWNGEKISRSDSEWKKLLGKEQYSVMRKKRSERGFSGKYLHTEKKGVYCCAGCDLPLFRSEDKYASKSGWPSFTSPIFPKNVTYQEDRELSFKRYEVVCSRCDSHLGHVFHDGPPPKHLRYCINSITINLNVDK